MSRVGVEGCGAGPGPADMKAHAKVPSKTRLVLLRSLGGTISCQKKYFDPLATRVVRTWAHPARI